MGKKTLTVTRDPGRPSEVVLLLDGKYVCNIPWRQADEVARLIRGAARHAEEWEKAEIVAGQEALLIRTGAPFGLSTNKKIREVAFTDAQWDSKARRAMPLASVPSRRQCGTPTFVKHRGDS